MHSFRLPSWRIGARCGAGGTGGGQPNSTRHLSISGAMHHCFGSLLWKAAEALGEHALGRGKGGRTISRTSWTAGEKNPLGRGSQRRRKHGRNSNTHFSSTAGDETDDAEKTEGRSS